MKVVLSLFIFITLTLWAAFSALLLGFMPAWLPEPIKKLATPQTMADFGQAFSVFDGLLSSLALIMGLTAILIQVKQNSESNTISALTARLQFHFSEYERLDRQIKEIKSKNEKSKEDYDLLNNMAQKAKYHLGESKNIDEQIKSILGKAHKPLT